MATVTVVLRVNEAKNGEFKLSQKDAIEEVLRREDILREGEEVECLMVQRTLDREVL